jgi:CubicO group peptidase (beta-lactamase class C family)
MAMVPFDATPVDDPAELGFDPDAITRLVERAQREIDEGALPGCQLALARSGRIAYATALGDSTIDDRYTIYSATKALVASAVWILIGEGAIDVSRRVVDFIPEFGTNGKDVVTIEQVMLHTSGFPYAPFNALDWDDRERRLERFAQWRCNWEPGTRFVYHATSAHWVLAELIERASGTDYREYIRARVIGPLGLQRLALGVPIEQGGDVREVVVVGEALSEDELFEVIGVREMPFTDVTPELLISLNRPAARAVGVPGGGGVSTTRDLALFYQALLHNPASIWKPDVLADVTTNVRCSMKDWLGTPANRSIGLVLAGDDGKSNLRGMGRTVSPGAFGHNGAGGQLAFADPATGLSFAYFTNGLEQNVVKEARRGTALASLAAATLVAR